MPHPIKTMRANFLKLDKELKEFGKTKCRHRSKTTKSSIMVCHHSAMSYGGMTRNVNCELENCPRVLYGDEDK